MGESYRKFLFKDFSEIWVKCFGSFLPIYNELWGPRPIKSKVYESSFQRIKPFVHTTSEYRDIRIFVRLRKQAHEVGPLSRWKLIR